MSDMEKIYQQARREMSSQRRHRVFINGLEMPTPPGQIKVKIPNRNEIKDLSNGYEQNVINEPGLTDISFDLIFPANPKSPYWFANKHMKQKDFLELFEQLKVQKKAFELAIIRPFNSSIASDSILTVTLEEYELDENANYGRDVKVSLSFKKYIEQFTGVLKVENGSAKLEEQSSQQASNPPKAEGTTYTVVSGDTLTAIALRFYGDASRYKEIAEKNNIYNPNLILTGQVLKL